MGRPIVIAAQRATKQDLHGFVEVKPRISAESAAAAGFNTLPRNFRLRPPGEVSEAVSATRRAIWPPSPEPRSRQASMSVVASVATDANDEEGAVAVVASPRSARKSSERAPRSAAASADLPAPPALVPAAVSIAEPADTPSTAVADHAEPQAAAVPSASCYGSSSDLGECSGSIWLVRHGERVDAVDKSWKKSAARPHDPPLTPLGLQQAAAMGRALRGHRLDAIYSSPFLRCMQTATAIAEAIGPGAPLIRVEPGLGEWLFNRWFSAQPMDAQMAIRELQRTHGDAMLDATHVPLWDTELRRAPMQAEGGWQQPFQPVPFPEALPHVGNRYVSSLMALREAAPFALLVTHGFGVQAMAEVATNEGMEEPSYCSATRMRKLGDADWSCDLICRTDHLAAEGHEAPAQKGGPMNTVKFSASAF